MSDVPSADAYAREVAQFPALTVVNLDGVQRAVDGRYANKVMLDSNDDCLRLAVFEGNYPWHCHPTSDELFLVLDGELHIELDSGVVFVLRRHQCINVPAGHVHRTRAVGRTINITLEKQNALTEFVAPDADEGVFASGEPNKKDY